MCKAGMRKNGNIKLGNMWTFSKLYGNQNHYIKPLGCFITGTCGKYCSGCKEKCYVKASYRYGSVIYGHAVNTIAMRSDTIGLFSEFDRQLTAARKKPDTVRINQSGEIESRQEFSCWCDLALSHDNVQFYLYTKAYDLVLPEILERYAAGTLPENITILCSIWHEYGLKEYETVKHIPNVKAFAYCDGYDYSAFGLDINTYCMAYRNGKLDHSITCDKCRKCFNRAVNSKVIGCNEH